MRDLLNSEFGMRNSELLLIINCQLSIVNLKLLTINC